MKIEGPRGPLAATPSRAKRAGIADGARFSLSVADEANTAAMGGPAPAGGIDALLALQEVPDRGEEGRRAQRRGHDLLDSLDRLRLALLGGHLDSAQLDHLAHLLRARRDKAIDPCLAAVLAEIEVRAAVEFAKLERA